MCYEKRKNEDRKYVETLVDTSRPQIHNLDAICTLK